MDTQLFAPLETVMQAVEHTLSAVPEIVFHTCSESSGDVAVQHYLSFGVQIGFDRPRRLKDSEIRKITRAVECMRSHEVAA